MRLLRAHILKTLLGPFAFAWIALTAMLMLNQLSKRFADLVGKGLPPGVISQVLLLFIPFIVALTLPMAILVSVLYGFGQMGSDNELTAMRANGVSVAQMIRPVLVAGLLLSLANFLFIDQVLPRTNLRLLNLQSDISQKKPTFSMHEQVMNNLPGSAYFLQASRIEPVTGRMREVVIYDMTLADGRRVIYADSGYMTFEAGRKNLGLRLYDGQVHEYKTAEPMTVNITRFAQNSILVRDIENAFKQNFGIEKGDREMTTCEMMSRVDLSRRQAARAAAKRRLMAEQDLRALLRLRTPEDTLSGRPDRAGPARCGLWLRLDHWMARLLLPATATAQSIPRAGAPPARAEIQDDGPDSTSAIAAAGLHPISDLTSAREEESYARTDINQFSVEIHKKFTLSVACFNFVLIGVALALRFPRGGIGLVIGGSLVIFALFYVSLSAGENLADRGYMSPALAMWLPNIVVFVVGIFGLIRVNREFGSTRGGDLADLKDLFTGWLRRGRA